jgi:uncharacterized protein YejL (UPF0352 family)
MIELLTELGLTAGQQVAVKIGAKFATSVISAIATNLIVSSVQENQHARFAEEMRAKFSNGKIDKAEYEAACIEYQTKSDLTRALITGAVASTSTIAFEGISTLIRDL